MIHINKKNYFYLASSIILIAIFTFHITIKNKEVETNTLTAMVINSNAHQLTVRDNKNIIYTFSVEENIYKTGDNLIIEYTGLLNKSLEKQTTELVNITPVSLDDKSFDTTNGIFSQFNLLATEKIETMTLEEKIGQILLVRYPDNSTNIKDAITNYKVGGFVFYEKDFKDKTTEQVQTMINSSQSQAIIPLLTAVDEEGGTVVRASSNSLLIADPFKSPRELYLEGGFDLIKEDTITKTKFLENLGLNVNLAPVVDVSTTSTDYMYDRTLGEDTTLTSTYAQTVIEASQGTSLSYVLKHFPGYGNNADTHEGEVIDTRSYTEIEETALPPFEAGIASRAEAILISHNTIQSIDENNPASLSASIHNLLRNNLDFTGVIITDDLAMGATSSIDNAVVKALLAGNDIIMVTDYETSFNELLDAVEDGTISEDLIDNVVHRILSWKYYKGLMYEKTK